MSDSCPLLYAERSEWSDLQPIPQYESFVPLAPIHYTEEYKDATGYFRAIVKKGEMSARVLNLTESIIRFNPAHYSAWQYRYRTLLATDASLDSELRLMDGFAIEHMKTYQVWHHRRLLLTHICSISLPSNIDVIQKELSFVQECLSEDSKNYHTWSYRQWLLAHFNDDRLWEGEFRFVEKLLDDDVRNNSAWHHRFFLIFDCGVRKGDEIREDVVRREVSFTKQKISLAPNNASAWNYIRGIFDRMHTPYSSITEFVIPYTRLSSFGPSSDVVDLENPLPDQGAQLPCAPAIEFLADIYETQGNEDGTSKAIELYESLAKDYDIIRRKYWEYRIKQASNSKTS